MFQNKNVRGSLGGLRRGGDLEGGTSFKMARLRCLRIPEIDAVLYTGFSQTRMKMSTSKCSAVGDGAGRVKRKTVESAVEFCRHAGESIGAPKFQDGVGNGQMIRVITQCREVDLCFRGWRVRGVEAILVEEAQGQSEKNGPTVCEAVGMNFRAIRLQRSRVPPRKISQSVAKCVLRFCRGPIKRGNKRSLASRRGSVEDGIRMQSGDRREIHLLYKGEINPASK